MAGRNASAVIVARFGIIDSCPGPASNPGWESEAEDVDMAWLFLFAAIALEVAGTFLLKLSDGFERWGYGSVSILCYGACFAALAPVMKVLPVGVVYAIWAGVGIVAAAIIGWFGFEERLSTLQFIFIVMVLVGAVGLRLTNSTV